MNIQHLETQYEQARAVALKQHSKFSDAAASEGRELGPGELSAINAAVAEATALKVRLDRARGDQAMTASIDSLTSSMRVTSASPLSIGGGGGGGRSLGAAFVASDTYRWLRETHKTRAGIWTAPASELMAAVLTSTPTSGGKMVVPDIRPNIITPAMRPTRVADLFAVGTTNSNTVSFPEETTFDNAAAMVAEGAAKPESTLIFDQKNEPVRKAAHWLPVTEEMLEDVPALQSYLDVRLRNGVELTIDDQLLNGDGTAPNLSGILVRPGLGAPIARTTELNADTIAAQISALQTATNIAPDGIVIHPLQWKSILLAKDTTGAYYGSGPFASPQAPTLWGVPVAITSIITAGTALVGAFREAAMIFYRDQLRVEASNSHADYFVKNLVAVRAERRLALAVYRPACFGLCTNLN